MRCIVKGLSISTIVIIFVGAIIGGYTLYKTSKSVYTDIRNSTDLKSTAEVLISFTDKFENSAPRGKYINTSLYYLSGITKSDQVIIGKNNWMFYATKFDGDPIADYEGSNSYSKKQLDAAKKNLLLIQEKMQDKNIEFCLIIPPNKESVYYDYMPTKYMRAKKTRTDILLDYLSETGVNAVNPKSELIEYSSKYKTYYKYDSHWNNLGAYIGVRCALDTFDISLLEPNGNIVRDDTSSSADLIDLADLRGVFEPDYGMTTVNTIKSEQLISTVNDQGVWHIRNNNAENSKTVLVVGDSFSNAMAPNLAGVFQNVYIIHRGSYVFGMIDDIKPDYLILEFVERYSEKALSFTI